MTHGHDALVSLLKKSRYLKHIEEEKIRQLADLSKRMTFAKGKILMRQNEPNRNVYIIIRGSVSVFVDREFVYTLGRSGDILGEMSVITGGPSNATIAADRTVDLVEIPSATLKQIHGNSAHELHLALYQWFSSILTDKLHKISQKAKQFESVNRRLQLDLEDARATQDKIFSAHTRRIDTFPLTLKYEFSNILGGDFYAVFPVSSEAYGILIGDVSGHGTGACILSMMILNLFMAFAKGNNSSREVVEEINRMALQFMHQGKFATLFYGVYHPGTKTMNYTNAGHHPAFVLRSGKVLPLPPTGGIPIGILTTFPEGYREAGFTFLPGDRLMLFTDAVFEGPAGGDTEGGLTGLAAFIEDHAALPSQGLVEELYRRRRGDSPKGLEDDFTLMMFDQL